jgi:hypothetical protein
MADSYCQPDDEDDVFVRPGCTCEAPSEFNRRENPSYDRHEPECALAPDVKGWLWYPHDGELDRGGVYVHPGRRTHIYLLAGGYLSRAPLWESDDGPGEFEPVDPPPVERLTL